MTNNSSSVVQNDVPTTPAPSPAAGPYADAVATIQAALDAIIAAIPATPLKQQSTVKYVRQRQGVKPELIAKAVTTAQAAPVLQNFIDVAGARDSLAFSDAFRPVFDRMNGIATDLKFAIDARHVKSGTEALTVYATAKRISQGPDGAELTSHVANMKTAVRRGGKKAKVTTEPPPAATAPTSATTPPPAAKS
jgi:hypothetical protein